MRASIIRMGNCLGVIIPEVLLEQSGLGTEVELAEDDKIVIHSASPPRKGWDKQFQSIAENKDDQLLDREVALASWDKGDWEW